MNGLVVEQEANDCFIYLGVVLIAQGAPLSVSELVGNPDRFNV